MQSAAGHEMGCQHPDLFWAASECEMLHQVVVISLSMHVAVISAIWIHP